MWALKRVNQLLKKADRSGTRIQVLDEIIRLGEGYSIVTEYTSFLVLENDSEFKRWKIERRNLNRITRDRDARAKRQEQLDLIKKKAVANIGPQDPSEIKQVSSVPSTNQNLSRQAPSASPQNNTSTRPSSNRRSSSRRGFDFGGGPVGPLFAGVALWLQRRKMKK